MVCSIKIYIQGGGPCCIKITPELSSEVQSVRLEVGLGTTHLSKDGEHYEGSPIPRMYCGLCFHLFYLGPV